MSNKTSRPQNNSTQRRADDFRIIHGLTKTAKAKLHAAGILSFAQLAAMSPHEIVAAIGDDSGTVTAERIIREDWIGQARKLMESGEITEESDAQSNPKSGEAANTELPAAAPKDRLTSFVLELKLNKDNTVNQTRVMHVESDQKDAEEKWGGWNEMRLLNFIAHRAKLAMPKTKQNRAELAQEITVPVKEIPVEERLKQLHARAGKAAGAFQTDKPGTTERIPPTVEQPVSSATKVEDGPQTPAPGASAGNRLEVFTGGRGPSGSAPSSEPYSLRVLLDPARIISPSAGELAYTVTVYAKSLSSDAGHKRSQVVGEAQGVITPSDDFVFDLEGARLEKGAYRLQAAASFNEVASGVKKQPRQNILAFAEGGVLQVF